MLKTKHCQYFGASSNEYTYLSIKILNARLVKYI
jgi:hypothetical protein